jgi:hypothetical protein
MAHALNLTIPIKQDRETLDKLETLKTEFANGIQQKIDDALRKSKIVHFARVLVVHDKFLQVITEYDGDPKEYTEFFRRALPDVFELLFSLAQLPDGVSSIRDLDQHEFFELSQKLDLPALGTSKEGHTDKQGNTKGFLFSAYENRTLKDILPKLSQQGDAAAGPQSEDASATARPGQDAAGSPMPAGVVPG